MALNVQCTPYWDCVCVCVCVSRAYKRVRYSAKEWAISFMDALFICTIFHSHKYRLKTFLSELLLVLFWWCLLFLPQLLPPPALVTMRMTVTLTFAISVLFMFIAFIQNCCHCISHTKIQLLPCDSAHLLSTRLKGRERISVLLHLNVCHFWLINIFDATLSWHNAWFRLFFA